MKSLATKLVVMLVVTIIIDILTNNVTFVTSDPLLSDVQTMAVDSINYAVNEMLNIIKIHI